MKRGSSVATLSLLVALLLLSLAAAARAATIRVPQDAPTIQAGLNRAVAGDTVLVAPGAYQENLEWPAVQAITLAGEAGPETTIVDGGGKGRILNISPGIDERTRITGLTFRNGKVHGHGAAIRCDFAWPVIEGNVFRDNQAGEPEGEANNGVGGAVTVYYRPAVIRDNLFEDNYGAVGGAIYSISAQLTIEGNVFRSNRAKNGGGAIMVLYSPSPVIRGNRFEFNQARYGGAVWCHHLDTTIIDGNVFEANCAQEGGAVNGDQSTFLFRNNLVHANEATVAGGALACLDSCPGIGWNTLAANEAYYGGAISLNGGSGLVTGNILAGNGAGEGGGLWADAAAVPLVWMNNFWANTPEDTRLGGERCETEGNFGLDPLFVAGPGDDYYLSQRSAGQPADSPCLDAGWPLASPAGTTSTAGLPDNGGPDLGFHRQAPTWTPIHLALFTRTPRPLAGGPFKLDLRLGNAGPATAVDLWLAAAAGGEVLFWPAWQAEPASVRVELPDLAYQAVALADLTWPAGLAPGDALLVALATDPDTGELLAGPAFVGIVW